MRFRVPTCYISVIALAATALSACGEEPGGTATTGGVSNGGGAVSTGGTAQGGVPPSSGGALGVGGSSSGGVSSGGASAGGSSTSGGVPPASGGASGSSFGGATAGASVGGAIASGGASGGGAGGSSGAGAAGASGDKGGAGSGGRNSGGAGAAGANGGGATGGSAGANGGGSSGGSAGGGTTPLKVWIAGDSTVQNCSSACPCGWGGAFDALFNNNVTVQNSAVGGRSVQTWLYEAAVTSTLSNGECTLSSMTYNARWTAMTNATSGMKAGDYLFIQFGINDGDSTCPRHVGLTLFKSLFGAMAQAAKDRGAQPIFVTPVSAIQCGSGSMTNTAVGTRGAYVTATKEAGATYSVPVIDLHQLSVNLYNTLGLCPNNADYGSGAVGAFFCADHTHFESAGAQQIAQVVAKALKDQSIPLASYLK